MNVSNSTSRKRGGCTSKLAVWARVQRSLRKHGRFPVQKIEFLNHVNFSRAKLPAPPIPLRTSIPPPHQTHLAHNLEECKDQSGHFNDEFASALEGAASGRKRCKAGAKGKEPADEVKRVKLAVKTGSDSDLSAPLGASAGWWSVLCGLLSLHTLAVCVCLCALGLVAFAGWPVQNASLVTTCLNQNPSFVTVSEELEFRSFEYGWAQAD